jgi:CRP/FNR family cyclic AMP-dependent transcriptional regulator
LGPMGDFSRVGPPAYTPKRQEVATTNAVRDRTLLPLTGPSRPSGLASLLGAGTSKDLPAGDVLIRLGLTDERWWLVVSGVLVAETTSEAGRRSIIEILGPGDLFGGTHGPSGPAGHIRSLTSCRLLWWPGGVVPDASRRDSAVGEWLHDCLVARLDRARRALARSLGLSVTERLMEVLWELASFRSHPVPGGVRIDVSIDQEMLAAAVGATRETVNRVLRTLRSEGRVRRSDGLYTLVTSSARTDPHRAPAGWPSPLAPASEGGPARIAPRPDGARPDSPDR